MAIELCDPERRRVRLIEELNLYEKKLPFNEMLKDWAEGKDSRDIFNN
jgi:hypothetical protein